ncbi:hypothetical protein FDJ25_gp123 [Vibrio phage Aphrodite1]|uniref:Uncharacterized protein n=1 Tax=Vibrio phage Aphrodite1 TaxID=2070057 RepID=A0A2I7QI20_9CAUD|nr:hypothetical protein FDJ25_gp123 [Vibrio phage Aphrodite1]AUR81045.1 hypothetical protein Aphrodite1_0079 [Vibrio phage Aphrodite1]
MSELRNHYVRDWLTDNEGALCCAEFFISESYKGRFINVGYTIKNRNAASVFCMLDVDNTLNQEVVRHMQHITELIGVLDKVHDFITVSSNESNRQRSWAISHRDIHDQVTISIQHHFKNSFKMIIQIGTSTTYFSMEDEELVDAILTLTDLAKQHNKALGKLVAS